MGTRQLICLLTAALLQSAAAQAVLWQRVGVRDQLVIGGQTVFVGDADGDGFDDIALSSREATATRFETGTLILSGKDGRTIASNLCPDLDYDYDNFLVPAGDMDGDGVAEFVRVRVWGRGGGATRPNIVEVRSLRPGLPVLFEVSGRRDALFGQPSVGNIDLNGDGRPDLLVAAPREQPQVGKDWSVVYGYDHQGRLLFRRTSLWIRESQQGMGRVGDLDLDGCDDFVIAGLETGAGTRTGVFVHSGRTQQLLVAGYERSPSEPFSLAAGGCGDVDGDGVVDFWGATKSVISNPGVVRVLSGATGQDIHTWVWPVRSGFGQWVDSADLDLDGVPDFAISTSDPVAGTLAGGQVLYFSGRTGSLVTKIGPTEQLPYHSSFADTVSIGRPQPDSPFPVFVVSEPYYSAGGRLSYLGRVTLFRSVPAGVRAAGTPCAGTLAQAPQIGYRPVVEHGGARLHLTQAPAGAYAVLLVGLSNASYAGQALPLSLDALGLRGCSLLNAIDVSVFVRTGTQGNDLGYASFDVPRWASVPLFAQWLVLGSASFAPGGMSNGIGW